VPLVLSSDIEGQPITVLGALVLGTPIIATNVPGPRKLLADGYGTLVEPGVAALASAMSDALTQPRTSSGFVADAYIVDALNDLYRHIAGNP
jgi:CDP-glycerol glycerophosphotransferase